MNYNKIFNGEICVLTVYIIQEQGEKMEGEGRMERKGGRERERDREEEGEGGGGGVVCQNHTEGGGAINALKTEINTPFATLVKKSLLYYGEKKSISRYFKV